MRILHITYWYPHEESPQNGIFIKNHIDGLQGHCENEVIHIQVKRANSIWKKSISKSSVIYKTRFAKYYKIQEKWSLKALREVFEQRDMSTYDAVNIHIASPLGNQIDYFRNKYKIPFIVTEHWTAYHRFFGLDPKAPGLQRMKDIFKQKFKLITVSKALAEDIKRFSDVERLNFEVVPNIIDTEIFQYKSDDNKDLTFFMLTNWSPEKNPIALLKALSKLDTDFHLRIGGEGVLLKDMKTFVKKKELNSKVTFLGRITPQEAAQEFQKASFFLHSAHYETFSVVCAEALCCGCPVIASNIPAITEYLDSDSGKLVDDFRKSEQQLIENTWLNTLNELNTKEFDRSKIAQKFQDKFGVERVSQQYFDVIKKYINE